MSWTQTLLLTIGIFMAPVSGSLEYHGGGDFAHAEATQVAD
ncbi:hypothetical protein MY10362_003320 [Beauveria mimosiformis]